jgi:hypothetical protein
METNMTTNAKIAIFSDWEKSRLMEIPENTPQAREIQGHNFFIHSIKKPPSLILHCFLSGLRYFFWKNPAGVEGIRHRLHP